MDLFLNEWMNNFNEKGVSRIWTHSQQVFTVLKHSLFSLYILSNAWFSPKVICSNYVLSLGAKKHCSKCLIELIEVYVTRWRGVMWLRIMGNTLVHLEGESRTCASLRMRGWTWTTHHTLFSANREMFITLVMIIVCMMDYSFPYVYGV